VCAWEVELQRDGGIKVTALSRERRKYAAYGASRWSKWEMVEPQWGEGSRADYFKFTRSP